MLPLENRVTEWVSVRACLKRLLVQCLLPPLSCTSYSGVTEDVKAKIRSLSTLSGNRHLKFKITILCLSHGVMNNYAKCWKQGTEYLQLWRISVKLALAGIAQCIECGLQRKGSPVQFPVRAHAWIVGQVPSGGHMRGNHTLMFLSLFLPPFPSL